MAKVSACPKNVTEVDEAFERMGCGRDIYGNKQYLCLPNAKKTSLVEFCYKEVMGIQEKGTCLVVDGENVTTESCVKFSSGCPLANYWNYEFYQYPACQRIDPQYHCFTSDPSCQPESSSNNAVIYILLYGLLVILFFVVLSYFFLRKNKKTSNEKSDESKLLQDEENPQSLSECRETAGKDDTENINHSENYSSTQDKGSCPHFKTNSVEVYEKDREIAQQESTEETDEKTLSSSYLFIETLRELKGFVTLFDALKKISCESSEIKPDNVYQKLAIVLHQGTMIITSVELQSKSDLQHLFPFLLTVFHKLVCDLKTIYDLSDKCKTNFTSQDVVNTDIMGESNACKSNLIANLTFLKSAGKNCKTLLEKDCPFLMGKICDFLSELGAKIIELTHVQDVESANRATLYFNVYSKLAILRSLILYTIFCINRRIQSNPGDIFFRITSSQKDDSNILRCITHATVENAVFHSVFHVTKTENKNALYFLQMNGIEIQSINKSFCDQSHTICWAASPKPRNPKEPPTAPVRLIMVKHGSYGMYGTTNYSPECHFKIDFVEGRELENVFYLRSAKWHNLYVKMKKNGDCGIVDHKPGSRGQWKIITLSTESPENNPLCLVSCIGLPGRFLCLLSDGLSYPARGEKDIKKVGKKGMWRFCEEYPKYKPRQTNFSVTDEKSDVTSILTGPSDRSEESIKEVDENKSGSEGHTSTQDTDLCLQSEENGKEVREKYWKVDEKKSTEEKDKKILSPSDLFFETLCELNGSNLQVLCDVVTKISCESMDIKPVNVFQKLSMVLNRLAVIYSSEELRSTSDLQYLFPFLLKVFHDFLHALKTHSNPAEECEIDSTLQDDDTIPTFVNRAYALKKELLDFESKLLAKVSFVNNAEKKTTSEDKCPLNEIRKFLSDLNIKIINSTNTGHADSANRATVFVNLYSRLAILRSLVLYTILCDKRRIQSDTKEISDWISSTQKDETDVLRCITKVTDKNAVFHSVFHLSERKNENVLHLIQMTGFEIPHLEKSFYDRAHTICRDSREHLKLRIFKKLDWKITKAYVNSVECNFKLECIEERLIDNVFYLRSVTWPNKYVTMKSSGSCTVVDGKPQSGGQWKMIKLSTSPENNPQCFLSCIDVPGRFLSLKTNIKSRRNTKEVTNTKENNTLWTFREEFQPGETS